MRKRKSQHNFWGFFFFFKYVFNFFVCSTWGKNAGIDEMFKELPSPWNLSIVDPICFLPLQ